MSEDTIINLDLYADQEGRQLVDASGSPLTLAPLTLGDTLRCSVRNLVQDTASGDWKEQDLPVRSLRASLGNVRQPPTGGSFKFRRTYTDGGGDTVEDLSDEIEATGAAADFVTACAEVFGQSVEDCSLVAPGCWIFRLADGSQVTGVDVPFNRLDPVSFVRLRSYQRFGGEWWQEVRLIQTPLAWNDAGFERILPPQPSIREIRAGAAATDASPAINEVQALTVDPSFVGTYVIHWNLRVSSVLGVQDTPSDIQAALNGLFTDGEDRFSVTNPEDDNAFIEFIGDLAGAPQALMTVEVVTFAAGVITFDIPLDRAEMCDALRAVSPLALTFEVEVELGDPDSPETPGRVVTLFRAPVSIEVEEIFAELATVQSINWQNPPAAKDYIPFTRDQIIVGQLNYTAVIGDGELSAFVLAHNLNTENVANILVMENKDGGRVLGIGTEFSATIDSANQITVYLPYVPDVDSLAVVIMTAGPVSYFLAHTHTIAQIIGLQDALDALGARVSAIEALLPNLTLSQSTSTGGFAVTIPDFAALIPAPPVVIDANLAAGGTVALPSLRKLLPAIHEASPTDVSLPLGDPADFLDIVFENATGDDIPLGKRGDVANGGFIGCDGRAWYQVTRSGTTNSFYPTSFEADLFVIPMSAAMWQAGQAFSVEFDLDLMLLNANTAAQYVLVIEAGTATADSSPSPVDPMNLAGVTWNAVPIVRQQIDMTGLRIKHHFGARINRSVSDVVTADKLLYSFWSAADSGAAPASGTFFLRARLEEFDTANNVANARGYVFYAISKATAAAA